MVGDLVIS